MKFFSHFWSKINKRRETVVEGLVAKNTVNKIMEVDSFLVKLLGIEDL